MADNARDSNDLEKRRTDEAALFREAPGVLGDRLGPATAGRTVRKLVVVHRPADASGYARGFRLSSELVGAVLVGAGIGWALDRVLGISPVGLDRIFVARLRGRRGECWCERQASRLPLPRMRRRVGRGRFPSESKEDHKT